MASCLRGAWRVWEREESRVEREEGSGCKSEMCDDDDDVCNSWCLVCTNLSSSGFTCGLFSSSHCWWLSDKRMKRLMRRGEEGKREEVNLVSCFYTIIRVFKKTRRPQSRFHKGPKTIPHSRTRLSNIDHRPHPSSTSHTSQRRDGSNFISASTFYDVLESFRMSLSSIRGGMKWGGVWKWVCPTHLCCIDSTFTLSSLNV